jgi:hypothetical protein
MRDVMPERSQGAVHVHSLAALTAEISNNWCFTIQAHGGIPASAACFNPVSALRHVALAQNYHHAGGAAAGRAMSVRFPLLSDILDQSRLASEIPMLKRSYEVHGRDDLDDIPKDKLGRSSGAGLFLELRVCNMSSNARCG